MPHVIVNQARMLAYLLDHMERSASKLQPFYGLQASDIQIDTSGSSEYPVTVTLQHLKEFKETGEISTIRAKYVVGCDGSRSGTRAAIGRELRGDRMNQSWGVLDALAVTDFPDIRLKCAIHSANQGNILIIPREGGYLVRFYVELDNVRDKEMLENRSVTPEKLAAVANRILAPYTVEVKDVGWWAVYEIGQRLCDKFDDVPSSEMATPSSAGVHRRRCLPHAQRQGRSGHERGHERHLESRLEARRRPAGDGQAGTPAHLLGRTSEDRQAAHRLRS
jgi:phenol 2-monooxygenase